MWQVFYDDHSIFTSNDGKPWEAPAVGALVLMQVDSTGKNVLYAKNDFYLWEWRSKNEWVASDIVGFWDYLYHHQGPKAVLFGRWTSNENFEQVWQNANHIWREIANGV